MAQVWEQQSSKPFADEITAYSFDERGAIYIGTANGTVRQISSDGTELDFSYPNSGPLTLVQGRNPLLPFLFFRDFQQAIVLDRFLSNPVVYDIQAFAGGFAWLATPAVDRHIWLLKTSPLTILKVDPLSNSIVQSTPLVIDFPLQNVVFFKAQRNLLMVVDAEYGVLVFDLFGNPILSLEQTGIHYAHISESTLITYASDTILSKSLTTDTPATMLKGPGSGYEAVIKRGDSYHFIGKQSVDQFTLRQK
ncbi:MAG: hypothetical protein AAGA85_08640 [Bacteroidota bacterium]